MKAAVFTNGVPSTNLLASLEAGAHVVLFGDEQEGLALRNAGYEIRDTLLVLGSKIETAFLARKPLQESCTVAQMMWSGTGALNLDETRTPTDEVLKGGSGKLWSHYRDGTTDRAKPLVNDGKGRWPANLVIVHLEGCVEDHCLPTCPATTLDEQSGAEVARFFPRFKTKEDLVLWLVKLVSPAPGPA